MAKIFPSGVEPVTITLYKNVPFDNTYKHHSFISKYMKYNGGFLNENAKQENFLNMRRRLAVTDISYYFQHYIKSGAFNFEYGNGLVTSVVMELESEETTCNYMKVENAYEDTNLFYFITGITQINAVTYRLSLELDVIMTFGDEFIEGLKDKPLFTKNKHCTRVNSSGVFGCKDFANIEPEFANIKASIGESKQNLSFDLTGASTTDKTVLKGLTWLYVVVAKQFDYQDEDVTDVLVDYRLNYKHKDDTYPFTVICFPLVKQCKYNFMSGETIARTWTQSISGKLNSLISTGLYKGAKVSPYPPFTDMSNINLYYVGETLNIDVKSFIEVANWAEDGGNVGWTINSLIGNNELMFIHSTKQEVLDIFGSVANTFIMTNDYDNDFNLGSTYLLRTNTLITPKLSNGRDDNEIKVLLPPYKKYLLKSISNKGIELKPELVYADFTSYEVEEWNYKVIGTTYPYDNAYFIFSPTQNKYNSLSGIGVDSVINYSIPVGENALDYWQQTQSAEYYQGKTAQAVANGLSIIGGLALIGVGVGSAVGSSGVSGVASAKAIIGGATMMTGGIVGEWNVSKSIDAHQQDLMNRPDSFTNSGSSYVHDVAVANYNIGETYQGMIPYVLVLKCNDADKETALERYFHYGYEVNRSCYFNEEIKNNVYTNEDENGEIVVDQHLFTRTIFNYIRIEDDITNKIYSREIPLIVKQKLNSIFNNGITLWTFFGFSSLWNDTPERPLGTLRPIDYLFKEDFDNCEYYGQTNN